MFGKSGGGAASDKDITYQAGWLGIDAATVGAVPSELNTASGSSPAATSSDQQGVSLTSGDAAGEQATISFFEDDNLNNATRMLLGVVLYHDGDFGAGSTDFPLIGLLDESNPDNGDSDIAAFVMGQGDDTSGNCRVDNNGTDTDGQFNFSDQLNDLTYYEVYIDVANSVTRFRENGSEIAGDTAQVEISAAPRIGQNRSLCVGVMGANNSTARVVHFRSAVHVLP